MLNTIYHDNKTSTNVTTNVEADKRLNVKVNNGDEVMCVPIKSEQYKQFTNGKPCLVNDEHIEYKYSKWRKDYEYEMGYRINFACREKYKYSNQPVKITSIILDGNEHAFITYRKIEEEPILIQTETEKRANSLYEDLDNLIEKWNKGEEYR